MATTPSRETAAGMLAGLTAGHVCTEACTGTVTLGDGHVVHLTCPWSRMDLDDEAHRRIIQSVYAAEARRALASAMGGAR
jgi:hypothetical protein